MTRAAIEPGKYPQLGSVALALWAQAQGRALAQELTYAGPAAGEHVDGPDLSTTDTFRHILGNVRAPDVLSARRQPLQLKVGAMLSPLPSAMVRYDPGVHGFDHVAEAVAG